MTCKAGTAVVMTNNTYHRGSRRRDDPEHWSDAAACDVADVGIPHPRAGAARQVSSGLSLDELTGGWDDVAQVSLQWNES